MDIDPIPRAGTVSDTVYARIVNEVLTGRWPPGEPMPSERDLATAWQVNRHAVREALKRVQQVGLVRISQGGKTQVLDWRTHAGFSILGGLVTAGVLPPGRIVHDMAVMRRTVATDAARLCALHADDRQLAAVAAAAGDYPPTGDLATLADADIAFWSAVIDGSGNLAYRLALNTLISFQLFRQPTDPASKPAPDGHAYPADRPGHLELAAAITARDPDRAAHLADTLLSRLVAAYPADTD